MGYVSPRRVRQYTRRFVETPFPRAKLARPSPDSASSTRAARASASVHLRQRRRPSAVLDLSPIATSGHANTDVHSAREARRSPMGYCETAVRPSFVQVRLPAARMPSDGARVEIVVDDVFVQVREDMDVGRLAALVRALAGREPAC
jgi:hypothetical protein